MSFLEMFKSVFQAFQRMIYDAAATILETVLIVGGGLFILFRGGGIEQLAWVYCASFGVSLLYAVMITRVRFSAITLEWDKSLVRHLFSEGLPIGINHFFAMVYTHVDTTMLGLMINDEVVAWYNAAFRLRFAMQFIGASIVKAVYPPLSRAYHESKEKFEALFQKTFKVMLLIGISLAVVVSLVAGKIIHLLYGGEYSEASGVLQIMVWALVLVFLNLLMAHTTRASDRQRFTARVVAFAAFFNVGMNALLIPKYSYMGAAVATLATEGVTAVSHLYYLSKKLVKPPLFSLLPVVMLINLPAAAFLLFVPAPLIIQIPAALILITAMTLAMHYFSREEIAFLKTLLRFRDAGNAVPGGESDKNQQSAEQE
jgi:O-antigen/teichoic acid export membrane protein